MRRCESISPYAHSVDLRYNSEVNFIEVHIRAGCRIQRFELFGDEIKIGRAESCELQLFEPSIELVHAKLLKRRERIILAPAPGSIKGVRLIDSSCFREKQRLRNWSCHRASRNRRRA